MAPQDLSQFGFTVDTIEPDEIGEQTQGRWPALLAVLVKAYNDQPGSGIFVSPFSRKDVQNFNNAARRRTGDLKVKLRQKQATRGDAEGAFLWLESAE